MGEAWTDVESASPFEQLDKITAYLVDLATPRDRSEAILICSDAA